MMRRPIAVTIMTICFLLAAVYLWIAGAALLVAPGTVSAFPGTKLRSALMLTGPYTGLDVGICYAVTGWGLFRLHNWARWGAMLLMAFGAALMLPNLILGCSDSVGGRSSLGDHRLQCASLASSSDWIWK
jgi:hypothetical protein